MEGQPHAPLPEPSEITVGVTGTYEFAPIRFDEPGNYKYTVRQMTPENGKIIADKKVYEIEVVVVRNENGDLEGGFTISNQVNSDKISVITFSNNFKGGNVASPGRTSSNTGDGDGDADGKKSGDDNSPGTGEPVSPAVATMALSGLIILSVIAFRKRRGDTDGQGGIS